MGILSNRENGEYSTELKCPLWNWKNYQRSVYPRFLDFLSAFEFSSKKRQKVRSAAPLQGIIFLGKGYEGKCGKKSLVTFKAPSELRSQLTNKNFSTPLWTTELCFHIRNSTRKAFSHCGRVLEMGGYALYLNELLGSKTTESAGISRKGKYAQDWDSSAARNPVDMA